MALLKGVNDSKLVPKGIKLVRGRLGGWWRWGWRWGWAGRWGWALLVLRWA
jgi:hypothetical protein